MKRADFAIDQMRSQLEQAIPDLSFTQTGEGTWHWCFRCATSEDSRESGFDTLDECIVDAFRSQVEATDDHLRIDDDDDDDAATVDAPAPIWMLFVAGSGPSARHSLVGPYTGFNAEELSAEGWTKREEMGSYWRTSVTGTAYCLTPMPVASGIPFEDADWWISAHSDSTIDTTRQSLVY